MFESINRYPPFRPVDGENNIRAELGNIQKKLYRWASRNEYWGPRVWYYLHNTAAYYARNGPYSKKQIDALVEWMKMMHILIACKKCKYWYKKYILPQDLYSICSDSRLFFRFLIDVHNQVNRKLNKPITDYEIVEKYFL